VTWKRGTNQRSARADEILGDDYCCQSRVYWTMRIVAEAEAEERVRRN
jgi:hypothetical protein